MCRLNASSLIRRKTVVGVEGDEGALVVTMDASRDSESLLNSVRSAIDHKKIRARRALGYAFTLFPVAKRIDAETEPRCKLLLTQMELGANRFDVNVRRDVNAVSDLRSAAIRIPDCLFQPSPNSCCCFAHRDPFL